MQNPKTLIIIPAYNEEDCILDVVDTVREAGLDYIVVNDGSTDSTLSICKENGLNVLNLPQNLGIGGAVQAGHKYALAHDYDIDIQFDGDGQHDVGYIPSLIQTVCDGADIAIGSRFVSDTDGFKSTFMRRVGIKWLSMWLKIFTGKRVTDPTSGFRACGKAAIALFARTYPDDYPEPESIAEALKAGLDVVDVPVVMHERQGGSSSIKALSGAYYMLKVTIAITIVCLSRRLWRSN